MEKPQFLFEAVLIENNTSVKEASTAVTVPKMVITISYLAARSKWDPFCDWAVKMRGVMISTFANIPWWEVYLCENMSEKGLENVVLKSFIRVGHFYQGGPSLG